MTTRKNVSNTQISQAMSVDPSGKLRIANKEKNFQQKLEKMQVNLATREVRFKKQVARGLRELANARKIEAFLQDNSIKPLSDYDHLKEIYENDLKPITADDLMKEAEVKTAAFVANGNKLTAAQEKLARELFELEAKANQQGIEHVRDFLIIKGAIKETPADRKRMKEAEELVSEGDEQEGTGHGVGGQGGGGQRGPIRRTLQTT